MKRGFRVDTTNLSGRWVRILQSIRGSALFLSLDESQSRSWRLFSKCVRELPGGAVLMVKSPVANTLARRMGSQDSRSMGVAVHISKTTLKLVLCAV